MKTIVHSAALVALALFASAVAGCKSNNVVWCRYPSMTVAEFALPPGAVVRVAHSRDESAKDFAARFRKALARTGRFRIAETADRADYLVLVQGSAEDRIDSAEESARTGRVWVETIESDAGSTQRVRRERAATHAAAKEISIAVYATGTLTPIRYFTLPVYDGGATDGGPEGAAEAESETAKMQERFASLAVTRMEEIFVTQSRSIRVPVPLEANADLRGQFVRIEAAVGADDEEALKRALARIDALAADRSILPGTLEEFAEASAAEDWQPPEGTTRETFLANYYLVALRREIGCSDPEELSAIHADMLRILELSAGPSLRDQEPALLKACPIALGRLEDKLARLRAL